MYFYTLLFNIKGKEFINVSFINLKDARSDKG